MTGIAQIVLLIAIILQQAAPTQKQPDKYDEVKGWSEDDTLVLKLEVVRPPATKWAQTQLKLTVTNTNKKPIVLDKELSVGFGLLFETNLKDGNVISEDRDVTNKEEKQLDKPKPNEVQARFVKLAPGQTLTRIIDLSKPNRTQHSGHRTYGVEGGGRAHVGFYYEAEERYNVPPDVKRLVAEVYYDGSVWFTAVKEFEEWFGKSQQQIGQWRGRAKSNQLVIEKK